MSTQTNEPATPQPAGEPEQLHNPLTLILPLKSDEAAATVRAVLTQSDELTSSVAAVLDALNIVHFARFVLLDGTPPKLAVITSYDGAFEDYILEFVVEHKDRPNLAGVFDKLLAFVADDPPVPVAAHPHEFVEYVRAHDLRSVGTFYSAYPSARVGEIKRALDAAS
jgi:hypothetical protein